MIGGSGSDTLNAGSGATTMTGGAGANVFDVLLGRSSGSVVISDMSSTDTLNIFGYNDAATQATINAATGSSFTLSDGTTVTFQNVTVASVASHIKVT